MIAPGTAIVIKISARVMLIALICISAYIAFTPNLSTSHWTPNRTMRSIGFSYNSVLLYEQYLNWFLHILVGFLLTVLFYLSRIYYPDNAKNRLLLSMLIVFGFAVAAEFVQLAIGRGVELMDILFGVMGILFGFWVIRVSGGQRSYE